MNYIIADCDRNRCKQIKEKLDQYRKPKYMGSYGVKWRLLTSIQYKCPDFVFVYVGDSRLNAFSIIKNIKECNPDIKVIFYSEKAEYAIDAFYAGVDYYLLFPVDDLQLSSFMIRFASR